MRSLIPCWLSPIVFTSVALAQQPAAPARRGTSQSSPPPREIVARAVAAMGGEQALRGVNAIRVEYYGMTFALGQEETPLSPARAAAAVGVSTDDYAGGRRVAQVENRAVGGQVNRLRTVTVGDIGMTDNNGNLAPAGPGGVRGQQTQLRRAPWRLLLAALDKQEAVSRLTPKTWRGETMDGVRYLAGADTLNLYFDRRSGLLTVTEAVTDDPILGDRRTVIWYTRWQPAAGVLFNRQVDVEVNGRLQTHTVATAVTVNPALADSMFAIPDSIKSRAQPGSTPVPAPTVTMVELGNGVWRAEGQTHHSLIVDQGTSLIVIEAPLSSARFQAVLDTLKGRFPNKPLSLVVNTHHHWDHSSGLRVALAAGIPILTHQRNESFVRGIAAAKKTVSPDALSRAPKAPTVRTVGDSTIIGSGAGQILVLRVPTVHVEGLLAAYVPSARVLFTSDALNPGQTLAPAGSAELVTFAKAHGLAVERYAGGHGQAVAWADVERAAATPAP